ncbi:hypothetical protein [Nocardia bovistercoris]|uniref:RsbT co-antagonist protein RsbRD N-terminal domain-containing protein n=1 Tax=Nocardia bovistercoris TaxID=2785916 RepID=A0A931IDP3_9NOCA|nr:hypothetical protein [Nocardia bovistercoris]MBH0779276.1 hypothetical protein [Nocardia bovistercoris]
METNGRSDAEWPAQAARGFLGKAGIEFRAALREGLDRAIALLEDLDESGLVLARLEFAAAQRAREGVPMEAVLRAVYDGVQWCTDAVAATARNSAPDRKVDGARVAEALELLTATVNRAYGHPR